MARPLIFVLTILLLLSNGVAAQETPAEEDLNHRLNGDTTNLPLQELIRATVEYQKIKIIYDPKKIQGKVSFFAPKDGLKVPDESWFSLLQVALKQFRLTLVPFGEDSNNSIRVYEIIPAAEAITQSELVVILDDMDEWTDKTERFVTLVVNLKHAEANAVRGALQNLTTRQGGVVNPIAGINSLIIADYSYNIRRLAKIIKAMDVPPKSPRMEVIEIAHADSDDVAEELNSLLMRRAQLTQMQARRPGSPQDETAVGINVAPSGNAIMVTGFDAGIDLIRGLVKKLDVKANATEEVSETKARLHVYALKNARAKDLAAVLNDLLGNKESGKAAPSESGKARQIKRATTAKSLIAADVPTNSLLINAGHQQYAELLAMIKELDVEPTETSDSTKESSGCSAGSQTSLA
ncbi:MAG: secretin N-terminal domain-containing protein, partial [Planctomycetota bacterium]